MGHWNVGWGMLLLVSLVGAEVASMVAWQWLVGWIDRLDTRANRRPIRNKPHSRTPSPLARRASL